MGGGTCRVAMIGRGVVGGEGGLIRDCSQRQGLFLFRMMTLVDSKGKEDCDSSAPASPTSPRQQHTNVYIHGLPPSTTDEALFHMCSAYGQIVSSKSIIEPKTNLCRGYGFVMYEHLHQAQHAIYCLGQIGYEASFAKVRSDQPKQANLYVSCLPAHYDEQVPAPNTLTPSISNPSSPTTACPRSASCATPATTPRAPASSGTSHATPADP